MKKLCKHRWHRIDNLAPLFKKARAKFKDDEHIGYILINICIYCAAFDPKIFRKSR